MSQPTSRFLESFSGLLLPISSQHQESISAQAAWDYFEDTGVEEAQRAEILSGEIRDWEVNGVLSKRLTEIISKALEVAPELPELPHLTIKKAFFQSWRFLSRANERTTIQVKRNLLNRLDLVAQLCVRDKLSPAAIANFLNQTSGQNEFHWKLVKGVLSALKIKCSLDLGTAISLLNSERSSQDEVYADATIEQSCEILAHAASEVGFSPEARASFRKLFRYPADDFVPYHQILLFICTCAEFWDHPPRFLYVFAPRGGVGAWITDLYKSAGKANTDNAVLNNTKAIDELDRRWAASRDDNPIQADALVTLIDALGDLRWLQRRRICKMIRVLCFRAISMGGRVNAISVGNVRKLLNGIAERNSETWGVLEQRLVDAIASLRHAGLSERGVGDSVFASNLSRKKLGDCDFIDGKSFQCHAYEAHAGVLSCEYVQGHLDTMRRVMPFRKSEWQLVSNPADWRVELRFIAHQIEGEIDREIAIEGIPVTVVAETFQQFIDSAPLLEDDEHYVREFFAHRLNLGNTPQLVRDKAKAIEAM